MDVTTLYFGKGALRSLGCCSCAEWCVKDKQGTVNGDCTVCDFNPWRVVTGLMIIVL